MIKKIHLAWKKTSVKKMKDMEDCYFYAFSHGDHLQYIGIAYCQDAQTEIKKRMGDLGKKAKGLTIWLGYVKKTDYEQIGEKLVKDIECLLIFTHQPPINTQCTSEYTGRKTFTIKNTGCEFLKKQCDAK